MIHVGIWTTDFCAFHNRTICIFKCLIPINRKEGRITGANLRAYCDQCFECWVLDIT